MNFKLPTIIEFYGLPEAWNSFQSAKTCTQKTQIAPVWGGAYLSPPPLSLFLGVCETWWLFEDWEEPFQNYWTWLACAKPPYENSFFLSSKSMYETWGLLLKAMMPMDVPISNRDFMGELYFTKVHFSFMKIFHIHQQNFIHSRIGNSWISWMFIHENWVTLMQKYKCKNIFVNEIEV
jgi:hypothetical protein